MRLFVPALFIAAAAAFRPSAHTPPTDSKYTRDVWNPWAVSSHDPEPQHAPAPRRFIVAEHVAPPVAKVRVADAATTSEGTRIDEARAGKLKLGDPLGSAFGSDSAEWNLIGQ